MIVAKEVKEDMINGLNIWEMFIKGLELKAKYGKENVADLSIGNPIDKPPKEFYEGLEKVLKEAIENPEKGGHGYMPPNGYPEVRSAIAEDLNKKGYFDEDITANHVCMTVGAAGGINTSLRVIMNPGEEIILINPFFVEYPFYVKNSHAKARIVDAKEDGSLDVKKIKQAITPKTKAMIINSPNNPTGRIYTRENLEELVDVLKGTEICVISDELYREINFKGEFTSITSLYDNGFMVYSFSKALNIPGERIGYTVANPKMNDIKDVMTALPFCNRIRDINAPALMQKVAPYLLNAPVDVESYRRRKDKIVNALSEYGYDFVEPEGTFYVWIKCPFPEKEFLKKAAEKKLLVAAGSTFGKKEWFRLACCTTDQQVDLGVKLLGEVYKK